MSTPNCPPTPHGGWGLSKQSSRPSSTPPAHSLPSLVAGNSTLPGARLRSPRAPWPLLSTRQTRCLLPNRIQNPPTLTASTPTTQPKPPLTLTWITDARPSYLETGLPTSILAPPPHTHPRHVLSTATREAQFTCAPDHATPLLHPLPTSTPTHPVLGLSPSLGLRLPRHGLLVPGSQAAPLGLCLKLLCSWTPM